MSDPYKLQALLGMREQEQLDAEEEYAREIQELRRRDNFVQRKQSELVAHRDSRRSACAAHDARRFSGEATLVEIRGFDAFLDGMKLDEAKLLNEIELARRSRDQQKSEVARAKESLIEATKELKAVQKHREKWEREQAKDAARRNSAAMDEVAARLWMENKR
jgi:flagellar export protein FliJ